MPNKSIEIAKYTKKDKQEVLIFLHYMWKTLNDQKRKERFEWRYEKNPYKEPCIFIARVGQKIVAFRAFIAQHFFHKEQLYTILSPCDTIVHPNYRRKGIMSELNTFAINEIYRQNDPKKTLILNTTTTEKSMYINLKEYWQITDVLKHFHYKFCIMNFFSKKNNLLESIPGEEICYKLKNYDIVITKKINGREIYSFINKNRDKEVFCNVRDEAFYNWKYSYQPEKYTLIYCKKGENMLAYFILKFLSNGKFSLEEYFTIDLQPFQIILKVVEKIMRFNVLRTWALREEDRELLHKCGFISEPVRFLNFIGIKRFPILIRPIVPKPSEKDFFINDTDIRKTKNWHLQISDRH